MTEIPCPLCQKTTEWKTNPHRPFCSRECQQKDLGKWANEEYRVPDPHTVPPEEDDPDSEDED